MINCFEYDNIKANRLPSLRSEALGDLEKFLQESWNQRSAFIMMVNHTKENNNF